MCLFPGFQNRTYNLLKKGIVMNISQIGQHAVVRSWWLLKLAYGLLFVVAGADKFLNLVTQWSKYVSPQILQMIPLDLSQVTMAAGIFEVILGLVILLFATRIGGYIAAAWLLFIALNLVMIGGYLDIAVRDIILALGALVLAWLDEAMPSLRK